MAYGIRRHTAAERDEVHLSPEADKELHNYQLLMNVGVDLDYAIGAVQALSNELLDPEAEERGLVIGIGDRPKEILIEFEERFGPILELLDELYPYVSDARSKTYGRAMSFDKHREHNIMRIESKDGKHHYGFVKKQ